MSNPLTFLRMAAVIAAIALLPLAGCGDDPAAPTKTELTEDDVASLFGATIAMNTNGFLVQISEAVSVARGAPLPITRNGKGPVILRDTTITRTSSVTVGGKTYTYNFAVDYVYFYTSNNFNNPRDNFFSGNKELKFVPSMKGTFDSPYASATNDSTGMTIYLGNTDTQVYSLNGKYARKGTYTSKGSTAKTFTGTIETALLNNLEVNPTTKTIEDGDIEISLRGKMTDGTDTDWGGKISFRPNQPVTVSVNGKFYTLDPATGSATKQ